MNKHSTHFVFGNECTEDPSETLRTQALDLLKSEGQKSWGVKLDEVFYERCFECHGVNSLLELHEDGEIKKEDLDKAMFRCLEVLHKGGLLVTIHQVT